MDAEMRCSRLLACLWAFSNVLVAVTRRVRGQLSWKRKRVRTTSGVTPQRDGHDGGQHWRQMDAEMRWSRLFACLRAFFNVLVAATRRVRGQLSWKLKRVRTASGVELSVMATMAGDFGGGWMQKSDDHACLRASHNVQSLRRDRELYVAR